MIGQRPQVAEDKLARLFLQHIYPGQMWCKSIFPSTDPARALKLCYPKTPTLPEEPFFLLFHFGVLEKDSAGIE